MVCILILQLIFMVMEKFYGMNKHNHDAVIYNPKSMLRINFALTKYIFSPQYTITNNSSKSRSFSFIDALEKTRCSLVILIGVNQTYGSCYVINVRALRNRVYNCHCCQHRKIRDTISLLIYRLKNECS